MITARMTPQTRRAALTFVVIGAICTIVYYALYLVLRQGFSAGAANVTAQVLSTALSTAANRRYTLGIHDRATRVRHQAQQLAVLGLNLVLNALALDALAGLAPTAGTTAELAVLALSSTGASAARILVMRQWAATARADAASRTPETRSEDQPGEPDAGQHDQGCTKVLIASRASIAR